MVIEKRTLKRERYCFRLFSGIKILKNITFLSFLMLVSACGSPKKHASIVEALPPPDFDSKDLSLDHDPHVMERMQAFETARVDGLEQESLGIEVSKVIKKCRIKDRFDRKALFAYEWSDGERLSLDVDGLGMRSQKIDKVYLQYKVSLQPELEKRDPCKYASPYRGILGSTYSELVVHEGENLYNEANYLKSKVSDVMTALVE